MSAPDPEPVPPIGARTWRLLFGHPPPTPILHPVTPAAIVPPIMTTREIIQFLTTFGWALLCGFLIFVVPLAIRRAQTADTTLRRVLLLLLSLFCTVAFCACAWYLWNYRVPKKTLPDDSASPPATLPASFPTAP